MGDIKNIKKIYFIGIGGIGMSALARYFRSRGTGVSGYDRTETSLTRQLAEEGIAVHYADDPAMDGLELALKGGQVGAEDFFETVLRGKP